jgi:nitrogen fixation NifU-like protein
MDEAEREALHQELILDHYRRPRNKGRLEGADASVALKHPGCADEIEVQLALGDDDVRNVMFSGHGCSISQASASMMTQIVKGKTRDEVSHIRDRFRSMVKGETAEDKSLGELVALSGVSKFPIRVKCALLAWDALEQGLNP